jgi:hypothetical protein
VDCESDRRAQTVVTKENYANRRQTLEQASPSQSVVVALLTLAAPTEDDLTREEKRRKA